MKRLLLAFLLLFPISASAQFNGCPVGFCAQKVVGGVAYQGPGDVLSYTSYYALRAYSSATRGAKLINVCNSTGGIDVGCADMFSDASTGVLVPATIFTITCPGTNCTIKTYYDLTGGGHDVTESTATIAHRDTLTSTCVGITAGLPCGTTVSGGGVYNDSTAGFVFSIPTFFTFVGSVAATGSVSATFASSDNTVQAWYNSVGNFQISSNNRSTAITATSTANAVHGSSGLVNGAGTSFVVVDAGAATTGTIASSLPTAQMKLYRGGDQFGPPGDALLAGSTFLEGGYLAAAPSSATAVLVHANAQVFWGYP